MLELIFGLLCVGAFAYLAVVCVLSFVNSVAESARRRAELARRDQSDFTPGTSWLRPDTQRFTRIVVRAVTKARTGRDPGFTLIELLVVVAIIAILASVVVPGIAHIARGGKEVSPTGWGAPVGPPPRTSAVPSPSSITLTLPDRTAAAELVHLATNQGYRVVWLNDRAAALTR